jgi:hypothetical protein
MMLNIYYEDKRKDLHQCLTFTTDFERNAAVGRIDSSKIELYHKTNSMTKIKIQELKDTWIYIKIYQVVWIVLFTVSATIYFIYKVLHHSFPG